MNSRAVSSVELLRRGQLRDVPYDLNDEYDRAIWTALQLYVDHLERLVLRRGQTEDTPESLDMYGGNTRHHPMVALQPWQLEQALRELRDAALGDRKVDAADLGANARIVMEALFAPEGISEYSIPPEFWEAGSSGPSDDEWEEHRPWEEAPSVPPEAPAELGNLLKPVWTLLRLGIGELVPQRDAAQRMGLSPKEVSRMLERGEIRAVRIGRSVLLPAHEMPFKDDPTP